jgi:hypothetical protein
MTPSESTTRIAQVDPSRNDIYRQLYLATDITPRRPLPPRGVRFSNGFVQWEAPPKGIPVTHYGIRIDHDDKDPDIVVPFGCRFAQVPSGKKAWVSSGNIQNELESQKVMVDISAGVTTGGGSITSISITCAAGAVETEIVVADGIALLALQILNNATGEAWIKWGDNFEAGLKIDIATYENSKNRFLFLWREGEYQLWSAPFLGE